MPTSAPMLSLTTLRHAKASRRRDAAESDAVARKSSSVDVRSNSSSGRNGSMNIRLLMAADDDFYLIHAMPVHGVDDKPHAVSLDLVALFEQIAVDFEHQTRNRLGTTLHIIEGIVLEVQ